MCIGLLYAMKGEIESLLTEETPLLQEKAGVLFYRIQEDIIACCGGVGKVNAAMATQLFIDLYRPDLILNVGVAGVERIKFTNNACNGHSCSPPSSFFRLFYHEIPAYCNAPLDFSPPGSLQ